MSTNSMQPIDELNPLAEPTSESTPVVSSEDAVPQPEAPAEGSKENLSSSIIQMETDSVPAQSISPPESSTGEEVPSVAIAAITEPETEEPTSETSGFPAEALSSEQANNVVGEQAEPEIVSVSSEEEAISLTDEGEEVLSSSVSSPEMEVLVVEDHELEEMEKQDEEHQEDYSGLDKEQLVKLAEQLNRDSDPLVANRAIQKIRPLFEALYAQDKAEALEKFLSDGNKAEDFEYKHHSLEQRFHQAQKGIFEKKKLSQDFQQKERLKNLEAKLNLLEELRKLVDDHEHTPGFEAFKGVRESWKKIGPVGPEHAKNLNASYFSLVERFYSLSEIYHNLRDFDRKKNLELKLELIAKIEKLADEPLISKAMKELMAHQEEYRTLGPVPKDRLDEIKDRLKKAVDVIYERRRTFNEERKKLLSEELTLKEELIQKLAAFEEFSGDTARDWQAKTRELLQLQEEWKAIPSRFREKTAELNKQFWSGFKKFMNAKNEFFKQLDKGKKEVLAAKQALVEEVNSLKDGEDWDGIANRMKQIQNEWRQIAPVFGKEGQKVYDEFKAGIDHFFTRLREQRSGEGKEQGENLAAKELLCAEIETLAGSGKGTRAQIEEFRDKFRSIGFVPMKSIQKINSRFSKAMMELIENSGSIEGSEKEKLKINLLSSRSTYSSEGVKHLKNQEGYIQKRLQQLRKDVGTLEDNVSMFRMSKNAMALIEDVQKRVQLSKLEIKELESQLKEIRSADQQG